MSEMPVKKVSLAIRAYQHYWLPELIALVLAMILTTIIFWTTRLDLTIMGWFYDADVPGRWPTQDFWLWAFFYHAAPIVTGIVAGGGIAAIAIGTFMPRHRRARLYGLFTLLVVVIGPGLIVNAILKEYWGRPRPRQVEAFGGDQAYIPPGMIGDVGMGKSFPCGHCSVGFLLFIAYFLLRRKWPVAGWLALIGTLVIGGLMGVGRMAAGGHFPSDVIWAGIVVFGLGLVLYHFILRIPAREDMPLDAVAEDDFWARNPAVTWPLLGVVGLLMLTLVLIASPKHMDGRFEVQADEITQGPVQHQVEIHVDQGTVRIVVVDDAKHLLKVDSYVRAFGFPTNQIRQKRELEADADPPTMSYRLTRTGVYIDYECVVDVRVSSHLLGKLKVRVGHGDIHIDVQAETPAIMDIQTESGRVLPSPEYAFDQH